jgi:acyl carrier protein
MPDAEKTVLKTIRSLLRRRDGADVDVRLDAQLYEDLMLDSLDVAEISSVLEDDLGTDPYSNGLVPRTVGEVIDFYRA